MVQICSTYSCQYNVLMMCVVRLLFDLLIESYQI